MRVASGGGTAETLTTVDAAKGETGHTRPQFLPGGRQLLFTVADKSGPNFAVLDLASKQYKTVAKGGLNGHYVNSGHLTFVRGATLFAVPFDLGTLTVGGSEVPVVEGVSTNGPEGTADYSVSDTGLLVYLNTDDVTQGTVLGWADSKGATQALPGQSRQRWGTGRLSPDGRRVANAIVGDKENTSDIWTFDVDRGTTTRLTFGGNNDRPIWSPDGRRIVYAGVNGGKPAIYSVSADGSTKPETLKETPALARPSSFTPDGKSLLYDMGVTGQGSRIFVLSLSPVGEPRQLHDAQAAEGNAQVSPDGRWVSYETAESGSREVYVQPFPGLGAKTRISDQGGSAARWARDGRSLFFWGGAPASRFFEAAIPAGAELRPGTPREVFQFVSGTTWDVTSDRNRFLIEITATSSAAKLATVTDWFDELRRRAPVKK